jgi:hypothetical protein
MNLAPVGVEHAYGRRVAHERKMDLYPFDGLVADLPVLLTFGAR